MLIFPMIPTQVLEIIHNKNIYFGIILLNKLNNIFKRIDEYL